MEIEAETGIFHRAVARKSVDSQPCGSRYTSNIASSHYEADSGVMRKVRAHMSDKVINFKWWNILLIFVKDTSRRTAPPSVHPSQLRV